ncbi:hypothetical protein SLEP1_g58236 [Rubroshorea leprosula]|uniref:Reverse transcriptase domain-containing protein n=1 Tax=Rubroshorea leprosula TaxID=152421 RepID=A0AAV5MNS7_9ROSI|nr:hypothetical protein SLEP1_g58236 [Rubroshorea leprosula]
MRERGRERVRGSGNGQQAWKGRTALDREWSQPRGRSSKWRSEVLGRQGNCKHQMDHGEWGYDKGVYKQATAFFFTNFPEDWSYAEMWIEGRKLWVNVAKYPKEKSEKVERRRVSGIAIVVQGKTYADAVKGQQVDKLREARGHEFVARANAYMEKHHSRRNPKQQESKQTWIEKSKETEWSGFEYNVKIEDYEWLQGCYVGTARSVEIVQTFKRSFIWKAISHAGYEQWVGIAWGKFICLDDSTSKKRRFDIARFLISTSIMDSISVKRQIRVNGVIYNLKFTEEEQTNSLFSIKYDFMPNFKSESENEESWSKVSDYEDEHGVDRQTIAGEEVEAGDTWGLYRKDMGLAVISSFEEEGEFELEKTSNDVRQSKKADKRSQSQIEEEDSVEVVADNINVDEYLNDAGDREDIGECNSDSNTKTQATTDPIEDSEAIGLELRTKPIREEVGQMHLTTKEMDTVASANGERSSNMQSGNKMRPDSAAEKGATCRQKRSTKGGSTTENSRLFWAGFASDEGSEKEGRGVAAKNEENVIKRLEEMESRDRNAKEEENSRKTAKGQKANGKSMSRLDRFLLSEGWLSKCDEARQWGLWCREPIKDVWSKANIQGWAGFRLKERLKLTKEALRKWNQNLVSNIDNKINKAVAEIAQVDLKGEREHLMEEEIEVRREAFLDLWKNLKHKESMLQQKSRKTWLLNGDANTKFFHNGVKGRWKRNEMNSIYMQGTQIVEVSKMKEEISSYFESMFKEEQGERPKLDGICFKQITGEDNSSLIKPFNVEEIKVAVEDCDSSKAPSPDGFNFRFVKSEWEVIKEDVIGFLQDFHKNSKMVRGLNTSFIGLIPKVDNPQKIEEFRPISLIGVMYKILAKILANRLKKVLDGVVGEQQMAFISGRQLMDGVVIANEVVNEAKKRKKETFMFKIDFEKAYDKVNWSFLDYMMQRMGFCATWRKWIRVCL